MLPVLVALSTASFVRDTHTPNSDDSIRSDATMVMDGDSSGGGDSFFNGDSGATLMSEMSSSRAELLVGGQDELGSGGASTFTMANLREHDEELQAAVNPLAVWTGAPVAAASSSVARSSARTSGAQTKPQPAVRKDSTQDVAVVTTASAQACRWSTSFAGAGDVEGTCVPEGQCPSTPGLRAAEQRLVQQTDNPEFGCTTDPAKTHCCETPEHHGKRVQAFLENEAKIKEEGMQRLAVMRLGSEQKQVRPGPCDPAAVHFYTLLHADEDGSGTCWELDGASELTQRVAPKCCNIPDFCSATYTAPFAYDDDKAKKGCREDRNGNGVGDGFATKVCCECEAEKPYKWDPDVRGGRCRTDVNRNGKMDRFADTRCCVKPGDAVTQPDPVDVEDEETPTQCTVTEAEDPLARLEGVCVTRAKCEARAKGLRQVKADVCGGKVCCVMQEVDTDVTQEVATKHQTGSSPYQMIFTAGGQVLQGEKHPYHPVLTARKIPMLFTFGSKK